jgi:O-acetyl-ADP-ribose deacetylase (regulator of RNase III)
MDRALVRLVLVGKDEALLDCWRQSFAPWSDHVEIVGGSIVDVLDRVDAVIAPGNSYGRMGGGVDLVLRERLPGVEDAVRRRIAERHHGYQPVGTAEVVPTGDPRCAWLVHAPTMRVPMPLDRGRDIAVHDALWAALHAVDAHGPSIRALASPGLGTGHGQVPPDRAAALMAAAYSWWRRPEPAPASERERGLADERG